MTAGPEPPAFFLNNRRVFVHDAGVQTTLLDYIRARGLTGAKEGCAEGECGACTVVLVANRDGRSEYRAVNSCLMLAPMAAGHEILTVEALAADRKLSEVQEAMAQGGGSQCGYCTPGFVMSLFAEQYRPGRLGPCDPQELGVNLCRCTGYRPIRDAALSLGAAPAGAFLDRLSRPAPKIEAVEYESSGARFSRPTSIERCLAILAEDPEARLISGGTDLAVESNLRSRRWAHLVSLEAIAELREFSESANSIVIGAALPLNDIAMRWSEAPDVVHQWLRLFASPPLRNRATLGGNLATASPIGDGAPLLLALDAHVHLASGCGRRAIPLSSFFTGYRRTVLTPGELIASIEIPKPLPEFARFYKVAKRRTDDISTVAAAMAMDWDAQGRIARARFAFRRRGDSDARDRGRRGGHGTALRPALERYRGGTRSSDSRADHRTHQRSSWFGRVSACDGEKPAREVSVGTSGGCLRIAGQAIPHESAREHVTGEALYTDDLITRFSRVLHAWPVVAPHAHALVKNLDASAAMLEPGVATVLTGDDVPGEGDSGSNRHDEPLFPQEVMYHASP